MLGATVPRPPVSRGEPAADDPFGAGPFAWAPHRLPRWLALHRVALAALVAWVPLALLSAIEGLALGPTRHQSMLLDFAAYGRYLVAGPAFVYAGVWILPQLTRVVRQFLDADIIADHDRHRYEALVASTSRLIMTRWIDAVILAVSFGLAVTTTSRHYPESVPSWVTPDGGARSLAGWWRMVVSQSLFHVMQAIWSWRLLLWVRFLYKTSRLDMNLVPSHPDLMGGLRFVLVPLRGFSILAFGIGAIVAGSIAESVLIDGKPLHDYRFLIGAQVIAVLVLFAGPTLFLMGPLIRLQEWGTFHYGRLAADVGHAFQQRWLLQGRQAGSDALELPDFSATTDLYSVAANVRDINPFVLNLRIVVTLTVATLIPYVPLLFAVLPVEELFGYAMKAFL